MGATVIGRVKSVSTAVGEHITKRRLGVAAGVGIGLLGGYWLLNRNSE